MKEQGSGNEAVLTGNCNSGDCNSGDYNSGNCNSGHCNSGNCNSGDYNLTDHSSGCFCTEAGTIKLFDRESSLTYAEWRKTEACRLLNRVKFEPAVWVSGAGMTEAEKEQHPDWSTTGGYLRGKDTTPAYGAWWAGLSERERDIIRAIPNFDAGKFKRITGIEA